MCMFLCGRIWQRGICSSSGTRCRMVTQPGGPLRWSAQLRKASWCCWMAFIGLTWELWLCCPGKHSMDSLTYLLLFDKRREGRCGAVAEMCVISVQAATWQRAGSVWWNSAAPVGSLPLPERRAPAHRPGAAGEVPKSAPSPNMPVKCYSVTAHARLKKKNKKWLHFEQTKTVKLLFF